MKKILLCFVVMLILIACNQEENNIQYQPYFTSIATVVNPNKSSEFSFILDNKDLMWITETNFPNYKPVDGQRIIANYNILTVNNNSTLYNHKVYLNDVYEVLTKEIFMISSVTQDSIGNDRVQINSIWIGSHFLNVEFTYQGFNQIHFINLVKDSTKTYSDGKVHLEFRHNANNDYPTYLKWGIVSFNLSSLDTQATGDSINLVIHTREFATPENVTYNLTYKFGSDGSSSIKSLTLPREKNKLL